VGWLRKIEKLKSAAVPTVVWGTGDPVQILESVTHLSAVWDVDGGLGFGERPR
jgi:hypothetical protein